jgi:hypothetical protein
VVVAQGPISESYRLKANWRKGIQIAASRDSCTNVRITSMEFVSSMRLKYHEIVLCRRR